MPPEPPLAIYTRAFGDGWLAEYTITERDGVPVIGELRVTPAASYEKDKRMPADAPIPRHGIGVALLRRVPMTSDIIATAVGPFRIPAQVGFTFLSVVHAFFEQGGAIIHTPGGDYEHMIEIPRGFSDAAVASARRSRGSRHDDRFLAEVAQTYVELAARNRHGVIEDLRQVLAERGLRYKPAGVHELLASARRRELLSKAPRGRAGGQLLEKALRVLDQQP